MFSQNYLDFELKKTPNCRYQNISHLQMGIFTKFIFAKVEKRASGWWLSRPNSSVESLHIIEMF